MTCVPSVRLLFGYGATCLKTCKIICFALIACDSGERDREPRLCLVGGRLYLIHVRQSHPERRAASICYRRWHERARQSRAQLSAAMECRAKPRVARHSPQSSDRGSVARSVALGPDPVLVQRSEGRPKTDQRKI